MRDDLCLNEVGRRSRSVGIVTIERESRGLGEEAVAGGGGGESRGLGGGRDRG